MLLIQLSVSRDPRCFHVLQIPYQGTNALRFEYSCDLRLYGTNERSASDTMIVRVPALRQNQGTSAMPWDERL